MQELDSAEQAPIAKDRQSGVREMDREEERKEQHSPDNLSFLVCQSCLGDLRRPGEA